MRHRPIQFVVIHVICFISAFHPIKSFSQDLDKDPVLRDTANVFYKQLSLVLRQINSNFDKAKDSLVDSVGQLTWTCKDKYKMAGARSCEIYQRGNMSMYAAFYLARDSKNALEASYHNLVQQLKDCMGTSYVYKEQKTSTGEQLLGKRNFECEMKPGSDSVKDQADMLVSVQKDTQTGNYELILQIQKHRGYY